MRYGAHRCEPAKIQPSAYADVIQVAIIKNGMAPGFLYAFCRVIQISRSTHKPVTKIA